MRKSTLVIHDDSIHESIFEKIEKYFIGILITIALIGTFLFIILR